MTRLPMVVVVLLAVALAGAASAKEPQAPRATAVLAVVGGEVQQPRLVWLNPRTLRSLKLGSVRLDSGRWEGAVLSPTGGRVAVGGAVGGGIQIVNVYSMTRLSRVARRAGWAAAPVAWPEQRRLLALEWNERGAGGSALVVVDPASRRVLRRSAVDGISSWQVAGDDAVFLAEPAEGIGPARVLVVDPNGAIRSVLVDRIPAGGEQVGSEDDPDWRIAQPGLAVDPAARRAYVIDNQPLLAEVDLDSLEIAYRELTAPVRRPSVRTKSLSGWYREAVWVGDGLVATSGAQYDEPWTTPAGLDLVDVDAGTVRTLEPRASFVRVVGDLLVAGGAVRNWETETETGMGLAAFDRDGSRLWHVFGEEPVWGVPVAGGYAYVAVPDAHPPRVRIVDGPSGAVRTVRRQLPSFVTP